MKTTNSLSIRLCAIAECLLLASYCAFSPASFAATSSDLNYSDLAKLSSLETIIYGSAHKNLPGEKRVESLEKVLFGKAHSGDPHDRITALASAINGPDNNLLAPPMAPALDRSDALTKTATPPIAPTTTQQLDSDDTDMPPTAQQDRIKIMLQQAMQLYSQGQTASAETIFKNVLALDSVNSDANFNLGAIAESRSDWASALHYYQVALKSNPGDEEIKTAVQGMQAKVKAGQLISKGASGNAQNNSSASNKLSPQEIQALKEKVNQAATEYHNGNYDAAISDLKAVASQAPDQADVQYALGQAYIAKGLYENARSALTQALFISPNNPQYKEALSNLDKQMSSSAANGPGDTYSSNSNNNQLANQNSGPAGQVTPFSDVNVGNDAQGWQSAPAAGISGANGFYSPGFMPGYTTGYPTGYSGAYMPGYASSYSPYGLSSGMKTAAMAGMAGMALGSMFGLMMGSHNNYGYSHGYGRRW